MNSLRYRLAVLFAVLVAVAGIAAYTGPIIGTSNSISVTATAAGLQIATTGPYTPTTYTAHGALIGEGTGSIVAATVGTNGQLYMGSTGADPVFATLGLTGITAVTGAGSLTLTATGSNITNTVVASGSCPYTAVGSDVMLLVSAASGAACTVNLPACGATTRIMYAKKQDANAQNIAVTPNGTDTIDGVNAADNIAIQYAVHGYDCYASGKWAIF